MFDDPFFSVENLLASKDNYSASVNLQGKQMEMSWLAANDCKNLNNTNSLIFREFIYKINAS